jgi:hypothetical protein
MSVIGLSGRGSPLQDSSGRPESMRKVSAKDTFC